MELTPKEIVKFLDDYVIGQSDAKRQIAIALRNRYRRMRLDRAMMDDVMPKNILMIGSTGVGKTEIARRLSKIFGLPFIKVEASKYTEVGFVGRDVESMVRDLVFASFNLVKDEAIKKNSEKIEEYIEDRILEKILPPLPNGASDEKIAVYNDRKEKMRTRLKNGELDSLIISLETSRPSFEADTHLPPEMANMQENFIKVIGIAQKNVKKDIRVKDAKEALKNEANEKILDMENLKIEALKRAQNEGIIFIDEIDKIAVSSGNSGRSDPSKEGVQRDLLPIVEGSSVSTKFGQIKTDHILFIAAGAFHISKPSDLIPELQGRFPLRVNLDNLDENVLYEILTKPKNSLLAQYKALLKTEGVELIFDEAAVRAIAKFSHNANENIEDIGARRLHTILEKVLEDINFNADEFSGREFVVTENLVREKLDFIETNRNLAKYIL